MKETDRYRAQMIENNYFCSIFLMSAQRFGSESIESMIRTLEV